MHAHVPHNTWVLQPVGRVWYQLSEAAKRQSRGASQAGSVHILALYILGLLQILLEVKEEAIDYKDYTDSIVEEGVDKKDEFGTLGDDEEKPE